VVADCQNGSLVFPLDSGPGSRGCFSARKWVGPNLGGSALKAWGVGNVTDAEREVSEGEGFYREDAGWGSSG
jgi:hypothetical protein